MGGRTAAVALLLGLLLFVTKFGGLWQRSWHQIAPGASSTSIPTRRSIAVLGFKNLSGRDDEAWISTALAEMLSSQLASGQQLRVIPGENIARMKLDLSLPAADAYARDTLTKIRNHSSVDMVVLGSYLAVGRDSGGRIRIDLQLQDTLAGETVAVVSQDGKESELANLISRGGASLRQKLGVDSVSLSDARHVDSSFSSNAEAARLYAEGLSKLETYDALGARSLLEKAIAADPSHALPHSALAESWSALGYDLKAQQEAKKAFELSEGLPRADRLSVEGRYRELTREFPAAIEIYRTLQTFFPDDLEYALRLASAQLKADRAKDALQAVARMRSLPEPLSSDPRIDLMEAHVGEALSDFRRVQRVAKTAATKGRLRGSRLVVAQAKEREGLAWGELGDSDKAVQTLSEARALFAEGGNPRDSALALLDLGDIWFYKGDFVRARGSYEEALRGFRQTGAQQKIALTLSRMGSLFYEQGRMEDAKQAHEEAVRLDRALGNGIARDLSNLANVLDAMGDLSHGIQNRQQAAQSFREDGDKNDEAIALTNLGGTLLKTGRIRDATQTVTQAMAIQKEVGHKRGLGFSLFYMAQILLAQDRLPEARATAEQDLALRKELHDEAHLPENQMQLAEIALEQGEAAEAEQLALAAATSFDQQRVPDLGAQAYADLARILLHQGKLNEAKANAHRARDLSRKGGDITARFDATLASAAVDAASSKTSYAIQSLEGLRDETRRRGFVNYELETRLRLGELELQSNKKSAGRLRLKQLSRDAQSKSFRLIARKANVALGKLSSNL